MDDLGRVVRWVLPRVDVRMAGTTVEGADGGGEGVGDAAAKGGNIYFFVLPDVEG